MAIVFAEGFDHYGTVQYNSNNLSISYGNELSDSQSRYNMLSGVWAELPLSAKVRYAGDDVGGYPFVPRTGRASLGFLTGTGAVHCRRSLMDYKGQGGDYIGIAFAVWVAQLPEDNDTQVLVSFLDSHTIPNVAFLLQPDGAITVNVPSRWPSPTSSNWDNTPDLGGAGNSGSYEIAATLPGAFVAGTWVHIEVKVAIGVTDGSPAGEVYLKVNEELLISENNVTTLGTRSTGTYTYENCDTYVSQVSFLFNSGSSDNQFPIFLDDIVCWDSVQPTGETVVTDWVGDKNIVLHQYVRDREEEGTAWSNDWGVTGGTYPKEVIDDFNNPNVWVDAPYNDTNIYPSPYYNGRDEDTYIVAAAPGDEVELGVDVPLTIEDILAVIPVNSLRKTQASTTKVRCDIIDGEITPILGLERPVAQDFTYYQDIFERDSNGNPWTPANINSSKFRITRTA